MLPPGCKATEEALLIPASLTRCCCPALVASRNTSGLRCADGSHRSRSAPYTGTPSRQKPARGCKRREAAPSRALSPTPPSRSDHRSTGMRNSQAGHRYIPAQALANHHHRQSVASSHTPSHARCMWRPAPRPTALRICSGRSGRFRSQRFSQMRRAVPLRKTTSRPSILTKPRSGRKGRDPWPWEPAGPVQHQLLRRLRTLHGRQAGAPISALSQPLA